jgi:hypothetical protein
LGEKNISSLQPWGKKYNLNSKKRKKDHHPFHQTITDMWGQTITTRKKKRRTLGGG